VRGSCVFWAVHASPPGGCWSPFEVLFEASHRPLHNDLTRVSLHCTTELRWQSPLFSLFSASKGVLALQLTFDFLYFFYQTWSLLFWFLFFLLLFFFDWIKFFDLIPNHLILIPFFLLNLILILMIANPLFWLLLLINYYFFAMPSLIVYFH
jgi:hypothetical protein